MVLGAHPPPLGHLGAPQRMAVGHEVCLPCGCFDYFCLRDSLGYSHFFHFIVLHYSPSLCFPDLEILCILSALFAAASPSLLYSPFTYLLNAFTLTIRVFEFLLILRCPPDFGFRVIPLHFRCYFFVRFSPPPSLLPYRHPLSDS